VALQDLTPNQFFDSDDFFGMGGLGHGGGRIAYLGMIAKEKAPPPNDEALIVWGMEKVHGLWGN